ncbi:MAG: class I SAM-dependent methyltransferase [Gammaproteobacteria bacterium]|nr:class I SAM-dependent methyltransferase [Gammaproteobacteria bacterium]
MNAQDEVGAWDGGAAAQTPLSQRQLEAFTHEEFVEDQVRDFTTLVGSGEADRKTIVDVGGGHGFFARRLAQAGWPVRVIETDPAAVAACREAGIEAVRCDALDPVFVGDEDIVCFNLILHHLVGGSEQATSELQCKALAVWRPRAGAAFVNEYIYESWAGQLSGWLIFQITSSRILSRIARMISVLMPTLRANTFGVGVRFRTHQEWLDVFASAGYRVTSTMIGKREHVSLPRRMLLIRSIRRDSFLLEPELN